MPGSAIEHVEIDFIGSAEQLAHEVARLAGQQVGAEIKPARGRLTVETRVAMEGNGLQAGVMQLGTVSQYTCPDCHGVLVQIEEGAFVRFRCHTGHAFSARSLISEVNTAIDDGLWDTLRAVEERVMLLRQMADLATRSNAPLEAERCRAQADEAEVRLQPLRELVLDPKFFDHDPDR